ncbi:Development-specific protein S [compost metagenome]
MTTNQDSVYTYSNASYAGVKGSFSKGSYTTADLLAKGVTDNSISSIKLGANVKVTLFNGNNFTGDSLIVTSSSTYLSTFNDKVSSMKINNL